MLSVLLLVSVVVRLILIIGGAELPGMKSLYWRPQRVSLKVLVLLSFVTLASLLSVERFRVRQRQPYYPEKVHASQLALHAFHVIKDERQKHDLPIDPEFDPSQSGLMGYLISPITTDTGVAAAKQTSINPNFAAVVLHLLKRAGVREGDAVAVGMSGSFPALNIATIAAIETLKAHAVVISSAGSSQWGANAPGLTWLDMEKALKERGVFSTRSVAVSLGGVDDRALGISDEGKKLTEEAVERSGLPALDPKNLADSVEKRMAAYREGAGDAEIRVFVNVGGGTSTVGTRVGKEMFKPGLNKSLPRGQLPDSVMARFASEGVPVIHRAASSSSPRSSSLTSRPTMMPAVGEGAVFVRDVQSRWLAAGALALIIGLAIPGYCASIPRPSFARRSLGRRILGARADGVTRAHPFAMRPFQQLAFADLPERPTRPHRFFALEDKAHCGPLRTVRHRERQLSRER